MTTHFTFFASYYDSVERLDSTTKGEFFDVLFKYALRDEMPSSDTNAVVLALFTMAKPNLDKSKAKRENGQVGGKQNGSKPKANDKQIESDKEKEKEKEKEKDIKKVPQKKPDGFVYEREFESLWELLREGDKWNAYKSWRARNLKYSYDQIKFILVEESKKQFGKRHFSTVLNGEIDDILSSRNIEEHEEVVRYV